jgi:hypothetical protein
MSFHRFQNSLSLKATHTASFLAIAALGLAVAAPPATSAQTATPTAQAQPADLLQTPALDTSSSSAQLFSSSNEQDAATPATTEASVNPASGVNFANYMQYGGGQRRRYGRPTYRGNNTTADGTPKYTFEVGVGFTQPLGNTWHYFKPNYGFQVGGGRNFNRHLGVLLQFDYDHMGLTGQTLSNQSLLYFGDANASDNGLDGSNHIWSFSLNPIYTLFNGGKSGGFGAYLVGGVGFYHKVTTFTVPQEEEFCSFICEGVEVNGTFDHYSSNAPGFNGGVGVTYKFSRFSNERFFGEVRYVFVDNSQRQGLTVQNATTSFGQTYTGSDFFPANSNRTTYLPVKFGLRF